MSIQLEAIPASVQGFELPAGTVVIVAGFPVMLSEPTQVLTAHANWPLIQHALSAQIAVVKAMGQG